MISHLIAFVLLGFIQIATAFWGAVVSIKALPQRESKLRHYWIFIVLGIIGLGLTFWVGFQTYQTDKEAIKKQKAMEQFQTLVVGQLDEIIKHPASQQQEQAAVKLRHDITSPQLTLEIGKSLNPKSALETRFILTNRNPFSITRVSYECYVREGEGNSDIHAMTGQAEDLPSGFSRSLSCDMIAGNPFVDRMNAPVLNLWISYIYKKRNERTGFRFWTKRSQDGTFEWFPGGAAEESKPN
jgi:hypothetical protein